MATSVIRYLRRKYNFDVKEVTCSADADPLYTMYLLLVTFKVPSEPGVVFRALSSLKDLDEGAVVNVYDALSMADKRMPWHCSFGDLDAKLARIRRNEPTMKTIVHSGVDLCTVT